MGRDDLERVLSLHTQGYFRSPRRRVAEIGAQQMSNNLLRATDLFDRAALQFKIEQKSFGAPPPPQDGTETLPPDAPFTKDMWEWLGFGYVALDIDGSPHSVPVDLNFDDAPAALRGKFDIVTNLGTTEHVANQMQAMKVIHDLACVGGIMMHVVPAQGFETHGLINYNPKFFWHLARSNDYTWVSFDYRIGPPHSVSPDIVNEVGRWQSGPVKEELSTQAFGDAGIALTMVKRHDAPYVPPVDMQPGTSRNALARKRYPTIFTAPAD